MRHRVFYFLTVPELEVSSAAPVDMSATEVIEQLIPLLAGEDDYVCLLDEADNLLEVTLATANDMFRVELPDALERVSFGRTMALGELTELLHRLPPELVRTRFHGFLERPW